MDQSQSQPLPFQWGRLIREVGLKGMVALLANHCEAKSYDDANNILFLEVHVSLKNFTEGSGAQKLQEQLQSHFGDSLTMQLSYGAAEGAPSMVAQKRKMQRHRVVMEAATLDQFLSDMFREMGAKVLTDSVRPQV